MLYNNESIEIVDVRQYRTEIVVRLRRRFFGRLYKSDADGLTPVKEDLCKMLEKMQASGRQSPQGSLCAVLPQDVLR